MKRFKHIDFITQALLLILIVINCGIVFYNSKTISLNSFDGASFLEAALPVLFIVLCAVQFASYLVAVVKERSIFVHKKPIYSFLILVQLSCMLLYTISSHSSLYQLLILFIKCSPVQIVLCFAATYLEYKEEELHFNLFAR